MRKILLLLSLTLWLTGCTHDARIDHLAGEIQILDAKVDQLQQDVEALRPEIQLAKEEAERAHYRLNVLNSPFSPRL